MNTQRRLRVRAQGGLSALLAIMGIYCFAPTNQSWALEPAEIALITAQGSAESQALAKYYCQQRGVPLENICAVEVSQGELLDRESWSSTVRPAIRQWMSENDPRQRIRCLVTLWDVPLKIGPAEASRLDSYREALLAERDQRLLQMKQIAAELGSIATGKEVKLPTKLRAQDTLATLTSLLEGELQSAQQALSGESHDPSATLAQQQRLQQLATRVGGIRVLLHGLKQQLDLQGQQAPARLTSEFDFLRGRALGYEEVQAMLELQPPTMERDLATLNLLQRTVGLIGTVEWLNSELDILKKNETGASFDSELSLVMWPEGYELLRWQPNHLQGGLSPSPIRSLHRTLMVSRIDGPTLAIAKRLIDDALAVEKEGGLAGKVYVDARGLASGDAAARPPTKLGPDTYEAYDRSLLSMAEKLRQVTDMEVILDESPELFAAGDCPEAALYCGWYSLGNYVDAFEFKRGAVAMHLASAEARTLREHDANNWCKRLLEEGAAATIGPVDEPSLIAFPRPEAFFTELVSGKYTLVEAYYHTKPFNSWMMVLIGDPLYRPSTQKVELGDATN